MSLEAFGGSIGHLMCRLMLLSLTVGVPPDKADRHAIGHGAGVYLS